MKLSAIVEPGDDLEDVCRSAQQWSDETGEWIRFTFNSVHCIARPAGDWKLLAQRQSEAQRQTISVNSAEEGMDLIETGEFA